MDAEERLVHYLEPFGKAMFLPVLFTSEGVSYATIELETAVELAEGLEQEINSELTEQNGVGAYLRFIAHSDLGMIGNRRWHRYMVEVVPFDSNLEEREIVEVTNEYLQRLPKVIRNYRKKHKK
jgi:hypothetical protein